MNLYEYVCLTQLCTYVLVFNYFQNTLFYAFYSTPLKATATFFILGDTEFHHVRFEYNIASEEYLVAVFEKIQIFNFFKIYQNCVAYISATKFPLEAVLFSKLTGV